MQYDTLGQDEDTIRNVPQAITDGGIDAVQTMTKYTIIAATAVGIAYLALNKYERKQIIDKFIYGR